MLVHRRDSRKQHGVKDLMVYTPPLEEVASLLHLHTIRRLKPQPGLMDITLTREATSAVPRLLHDGRLASRLGN